MPRTSVATKTQTQGLMPAALGAKAVHLSPVSQAFLDLHEVFRSVPRGQLAHGLECVHHLGHAPHLSPLTYRGEPTYWDPTTTGHGALQRAGLLARIETAFLAFVAAVQATPALARMGGRLSVRFLRGGTGLRGVARASITWGDVSGDVCDAPGAATLLQPVYGHSCNALDVAKVLDAAARTSGPTHLHAFVSMSNRQPHAAWAATDTLLALAPSLCSSEDDPSLWTHVGRFVGSQPLHPTAVPAEVLEAHAALFALAHSRSNTTGEDTPVFLLRTGARSCTQADRGQHPWMASIEALWEGFWDAMERWIPGVAHRDVPGVHTLHLGGGTHKTHPIAFYGVHQPNRNPTSALQDLVSPLATLAHGRLWGASAWGASGPWYVPGMTAADAARAAYHLHAYHRNLLRIPTNGVAANTRLITAPEMEHVDVWEQVR
jgi:hypothetical protein